MIFIGLPEELYLDILKRLSVKTLLRLRSVCKSWRLLLSSPSFIHTHQSFISTADDQTTYLRQGDVRCFLHRQTTPHDQDMLLPLPSIPHRDLVVTVLNVINGVVSFKYSDCSNLALPTPRFIVFWNPSVRRLVSAPLPPEDKEDNHQLLGVGFDASKYDFKAVWVPPFDKGYYKVFSARDGAWKRREWKLPKENYIKRHYRGGCFFNGAIYWITDAKNGRPHGFVYFDCESDEFGRMELPREVLDVRETLRVFVYRGLLSVITNESDGDHGLWRMREHGVWAKDLITKEEYKPNDFLCRYDLMGNKINILARDTIVLQETMSLLDIGKPCHHICY